MPRDTNGNYSLPAGTLVNAGDTVLPSQHNPAMNDLAASMGNSLSRDGNGQMRAPLDMGGFDIVSVGNLGVGVNLTVGGAMSVGSGFVTNNFSVGVNLSVGGTITSGQITASGAIRRAVDYYMDVLAGPASVRVLAWLGNNNRDQYDPSTGKQSWIRGGNAVTVMDGGGNWGMSTVNLLELVASSIPTPPSGTQTLFFDSSNGGKLSRKTSAGTVVAIG